MEVYRNKKNIITITSAIACIIILLLFFGYLSSSRNKKILDASRNDQKNTQEEIISKEEKEEKEEEIEDTSIKEEKDIPEPSNTASNNKNDSIQNKNNNQNKTNDYVENKETTPRPVEPTVPIITYSCPEGYSLNGTICTSIVEAAYVCPEGTTSYASQDIPRDTYCVNLSEGYQTDTESCPAGYGSILMISLGGSDTYKCLPLHAMIYTCPDGYNLNGTQCSKTIAATEN